MKSDQVHDFVHILRYPDNIATKRSKIAYLMFRWNYCVNVGRGQVIGRITNQFPELGWIVAFLEIYTPLHFTLFWIAVLIFGSYAISWILGYYWMKWRFDMIDSQAASERSMLTQEMHKSIVRKREKI